MNQELRRQAIAAFRDKFGRDPRWLATAPGRVNLIGEHTDYNGGHVLPVAVDRHVVVAADAARGRSTRFWSTLDGQMAEFDESKPSTWKLERWARYAAGPAATLAWEGARIKPMDAAIVTNLPAGAGLSSSAALEVAAALAYLAVCGGAAKFDHRKLAKACQAAEHKFAGVKCGIMDQFTAVAAEQGKALYLDCYNLFAQQVPVPESLAVLVADSKIPRKLVDAEYNRRREDCEEAARKLSAELGRGVHLAEVTHEELLRWGKKVLNERLFRRARHVVDEEFRTARAVEYLKRGQVEAFGELARESHRSLAEDFEVSCAELDTLVRLACGIDGVYGARLTGAGFGGAAVVFAEAAAAEDVSEELAAAYRKATGLETQPVRISPAAGARVEEL